MPSVGEDVRQLELGGWKTVQPLGKSLAVLAPAAHILKLERERGWQLLTKLNRRFTECPAALLLGV